MADMKDVINQLKENNASEKERDSNLNRNISNLRERNVSGFAELSEALTGVKQQAEQDSTNDLSPSQIEENNKETAANEEKNQSLLSTIAEKVGGLKSALTSGFKTLTGGEGTFGKIVRGTLLAGLFFAIANFFNSKMYQDMIDYITKTLIPKLQFFYNQFFGPDGGFIKGFKSLFSDESGIGAIVAGIIGVGSAIAIYKVAGLFTKIKSGVGRLGGFLSNVGSRLKNMVLPKTPKGLPSAPGAPTKGSPLAKAGQPGRVASFAKGVKDIGVSAGKGIGGFIGGILKGIASGLAAIANPLTLIGLAAVVLAINGIAAAIRIASPAFKPIGELLKDFGKTIREAFDGVSTFVTSTGAAIERVILSIGESIGKVIDKISAMKTAGTDATTKQIKELSKIPADKIFSAAKGIDAMKKALDGFGGGTFSKIAGNLFGGDGPIDKIVDLAKKVPELMRAAEAINLISAAGGDYEIAKAEIDRRKRVAEIEKRLGGKMRGDTKNKLEAELGALKSQYTESNFALAKRGDGMQLGKLFTSSQPGIVTFSEKTAEIMRSALNKSSGNGGVVNINAPSDNKVTNSSSQTTSNNTAISNPDPLIQAAFS